MSDSQEFTLTIAQVPKITELPSAEAAIAAARIVIDSTKDWKHGKTYHNGVVQSLSRPKGPGDGAGWHCRVSEHGPADATFDELWKYLAIEHATTEKEYIKVVKRTTLIKQIAPLQAVWSMYYEFPTPGVSSRVFTALQIAHLEENSGRRTGWFVQIPVDLTDDAELAQKEEKGVKGKYTSAERFVELENGKIEWRMATSSTPGGHLPSFIVESSMAGQIAADVPHFLKWLHSVRKPDGAATNAKEHTDTAHAGETGATPAINDTPLAETEEPDAGPTIAMQLPSK